MIKGEEQPEKTKKDSRQEDKFWDSEWLKWLGLVSNLFDAATLMAGMVAGLIYLLFLRDRPTEEVLASFVTAVTIAFMVSAVFVIIVIRYRWVAAEPKRIMTTIWRLKQHCSPFILDALWEIPGRLLALQPLQQECSRRGCNVESMRDCAELTKHRLASLDGDLVGLSKRVRKHIDQMQDDFQNWRDIQGFARHEE